LSTAPAAKAAPLARTVLGLLGFNIWFAAVSAIFGQWQLPLSARRVPMAQLCRKRNAWEIAAGACRFGFNGF
jgi:hypothetical protein